MSTPLIGKAIAPLYQPRHYDAVKRLLDVIIASVALLISFPVMLLSAVAVHLDTPGPPFYSQERVGKNGHPFLIYKVRTMKVGSEPNGPQLAAPNDPRVTRIGRLLRRYRLDELPQFWNILRGDMSLIGPRPERRAIADSIMTLVPEFALRTSVLPGLTGWAQVNGGYDLDPTTKLQLDLYYISHRSLRFDLLILARTIVTVATGQGAR